MRTFPLSEYLVTVRHFQEMVSTVMPDDDLTADEREKSTEALKEFAKDAEKYGLTFTADQFRRMAEACGRGESHWEITRMTTDALNRLEDECRQRLMIMVDPEHLKYIDDSRLFDPPGKSSPKVSSAFPSAGEDIAEAGVCLALGRATACVMHLARVLEVGLQALASALGVTKQNDWGAYLRKMDQELQKRFAAAGARTPEEQFYAEAHTCFDAMRRAWRNPTMHVDKVYSIERAEEILISVRSFMRHLATRLHE